MKLLVVSTHDVACGIAGYNNDLVAALRLTHECVIVSLPPDGSISEPSIRDIAHKARQFDGVIIQHEWAFFGRDLRSQHARLAQLLRLLRLNGAATVLIMHTAMVSLPKIRLRRGQFFRHLKIKLARNGLVREINAARKLRIFGHGRVVESALIAKGVKPGLVERLTFPLRPELAKQQVFFASDRQTVDLAMFGFISAYKGYEVALNALRLLPKNVRLLIAGDRHPFSPNDLTLENILNFIRTGLWVHDRRVHPVDYEFGEDERREFECRVVLLGHLPEDEIVKVLSGADMVLAPYFAEDSPAGSAAAAWPISLGKPTITSSVRTFEDYIEAECVLTVAPRAPNELARAIRKIMQNPEIAEGLAAKAREFSNNNSVERLADRVASVLASFAASQPAKPVPAPLQFGYDGPNKT